MDNEITNAEAIRQGLLTDRQIWDIWEHLDRNSEEWCEWLNEPYKEDKEQ